jgi:hypothetical protein
MEEINTYLWLENFKRRNHVTGSDRKDIIKVDLIFNICMNIFKWNQNDYT